MIYFIGNEYLIKIGFSDNIQQRIYTFESDIPFDFEIFGIIEGDEIKEQYLHMVFAEFHVNREWFRNCQPILDYVEKEKIEIEIKRNNRHKRYFGELRKLRLAAGLTMESMGNLLGIHASQIDKFERRYEQGKGNISSLNKYLSVLGYEVQIIKRQSGGSLNSQG